VVPGLVVWGFSTPVLWYTGRPYQEFCLQLPLLALATVALVLVVPYGVGPAAWVAAALVLARCAVLCTAACRALQLPLRDFAADFARALVLGTPMVLAALAVPALLPVTVWPVVRLVAGLAGGGLAALLQLWLRPGVLGPQAGALLRRLAPRFAARLKS